MSWRKDTFCSYCGEKHTDVQYPKKCDHCCGETYLNPLPVVCAVVPILTPTEFGVLTVRRNIQPDIGQLVLPGGYMDTGESLNEAAAREVAEETGVIIDPTLFRLFTADGFPSTMKSPTSDAILIFMECRDVIRHDGPFAHDHEVQEVVVATHAIKLAWQTHTHALRAYYNENWHDDFRTQGRGSRVQKLPCVEGRAPGIDVDLAYLDGQQLFTATP